MQAEACEQELPELTAYFQSGGMVDAVLNLGLPAPIDVQVAGSNMEAAYQTALSLASARFARSRASRTCSFRRISTIRRCSSISTARAPLNWGSTSSEVVGNVITALTSNQMIAPSYWVDPKTGNDYMLTVQYPENQIKSHADLQVDPAARPEQSRARRGSTWSAPSSGSSSPTEVDHYQIRRTIDIYVRPLGEDLGRIATDNRPDHRARPKLPEG